MRETFEVVAGLLTQILPPNAVEMRPDLRLTRVNGVAPMDVAKLAIACERAYGLSLYDEKIAQWQTLADVCAHIEELLEEGMDRPAQRSDEERTGWYYQ